ncbi:von Willebrand factor type A domain-containing protein, partial [Myxococcota bacterium]|nr:von Willebrand factor type A domain-containing protein [Myxococcota bacterium]
PAPAPSVPAAGALPPPLLPSSAGRGPLPNRPPTPVRALVRLVEVRFVPRTPTPPVPDGAEALAQTSHQPLAPLPAADDGASWRAVRQALAEGRLPDPSRVRPQALVQAHAADLPLPADAPVAVDAEVAPDPWHAGRHLLRLALRAADVAGPAEGPRTIVALVDTSGSMALDGRLDHVKAALHALVGGLGPDDRLALVAFSDRAEERVAAVGPDQAGALHAAIEALAADGASDQALGLARAWQSAQAAWTPGAAQRVVLFTDGEANLGVRLLGPLGEEAAAWAARGLRLDVVGVGLGEEPDPAVAELATRGGGRLWALSGFDRALPLARDLAGAGQGSPLRLEARVAFSPQRVRAWRVFGPEGRPAAPEEGSPAPPAAPLRLSPGEVRSVLYQVELAPQPADEPDAVLLELRLALGEGPDRRAWAVPIPTAVVRGRFEAASRDLRVAAAAARFGLLLRAPPRTFAPWAEVADLADPPGTDARATDQDLARLARQAGRLAARGELPTPADALGPRDRALLDQRLLRAQHSLDPCATAAGASGRLDLSLVLSAGEVVAATARHDGHDGAVEACAAEVARQWRFPSGWSAALEVPVLLASR